MIQIKPNMCTYLTIIVALYLLFCVSVPAAAIDPFVTVYIANITAHHTGPEAFSKIKKSFPLCKPIATYQNSSSLRFYFNFPSSLQESEVTRCEGIINQSTELLNANFDINGLMTLKVPTSTARPNVSEWEYRIEDRIMMVRPGPDSPWGFVCGDDFTLSTALIACKSAGLEVTEASFSRGSVPFDPMIIYMDDVKCTNNAKSLAECSFIYSTELYTAHNCSKGMTVILDCGPTTDASKLERSDPSLGAPNRTLISHRHSNVFKGLNTIPASNSYSQRPNIWEVTIHGSSPYGGLLAVRPAGMAKWGTVCGTGFGEKEAVVACQNAGFLNVITAKVYDGTSNKHNTGSGPIYMLNVNCTGIDAKSLADCTYVYAAENDQHKNCGHDQDVTIDCFPNDKLKPPGGYRPPPTNWEFRINGGTDQGIIDVRPSSSSPWGMICDDHWDGDIALVACHTLGYKDLKSAFYSSKRYHTNSPIIYMNNVKCSATATNLTECFYVYSTEFTTPTDCNIDEAVYINCRLPPVTDPSKWELRIVPSIPNEPFKGLLEVKPNPSAAWGRVCSVGFGGIEALAACRSLGYGNIPVAFPILDSEFYRGWTYLSKVHCKDGDYLQNCSYLYSSPSQKRFQCPFRKSVGINCEGIIPTNNAPVVDFTATLNASAQTTENFLVVLSSSLYTKKDRIQVLSDTLSEDGKLRTVVFRFLDPAHFNWVTEPSRDQLDKWLLGILRPDIYTLLNVIEIMSNTTKDQRPTGWEFKLISPPYFTNCGLLTLRPNSSAPWGTVCGSGFTEANALAACRSLGYDNITAASIEHYTAKDSRYVNFGPIYMSNVWCKPGQSVDRQLLQNCYYSYTIHNCRHSGDVWLTCGRNQDTPILDFKLVDDPTLGITGDPRIGRMKVQTKVNGPYDDVCGDDFNDIAVTAACRTLGFDVEHGGKIVMKDGMSNLHTAMDYVTCPADNSGLKDCTYKLNPEKRWFTYCRLSLFLDCHERHPEKWKFRIIIDSPDIGRLEMQPDIHSDWGTVCSNMFNNYSALMMCKAIGFTDITSARAILNYSSDKPSTGSKRPTYLTDVVCDENSTSLKNCTYAYNSRGIPQSSVCNDMTDVGIDCSGTHTPPTPPIPTTPPTPKGPTANPTNTDTDPKPPPAKPSDKPSDKPSPNPSKDTPSPNPSKDTPSPNPSKDTPTPPMRPPSIIFTAIISVNSDTFKTRLTVYMDISPSSVEVLSFDSNSHQVKFRFIDHDSPGTPNPKALEAKLLRQWKEHHGELMRETGITLMHVTDTVGRHNSNTEDTKGSSALPIVLGVLGAVVLVGLAVGGIIMYKKRSTQSTVFVRNDENFDYMQMEGLINNDNL